MGWTKVFPVDELVSGTKKVAKVGQRKILLINHEGNLYAVDNACPHVKLPLKNGKVTEDGAIVCPFHRSAFDLKTGAVKEWSTWPPLVGKALGSIAPKSTASVSRAG